VRTRTGRHAQAERSSKKGKTHILNEFIQLTSYNRCYAGQVLMGKKEKLLGYYEYSREKNKICSG